MGQMMGTMGNPSLPATGSKGVRMLAGQDFYRERTTGFEPATLTLARLWFTSAESVPVR